MAENWVVKSVAVDNGNITSRRWPETYGPRMTHSWTAGTETHLVSVSPGPSSQLARENTATLCRWRLVSEGPRSWPHPSRTVERKPRCTPRAPPCQLWDRRGWRLLNTRNHFVQVFRGQHWTEAFKRYAKKKKKNKSQLCLLVLQFWMCDIRKDIHLLHLLNLGLRQVRDHLLLSFPQD